MDFLRYAERAADLVNVPLEDEDDLRSHLADRPWLADRITSSDVRALRRLQRDLRPVFLADPAPDAGGDGPGAAATEAIVERLNTLLARHPVSPFISVTARRDSTSTSPNASPPSPKPSPRKG